MRNYRFEGFLTVGTGKFSSYSFWDENNHPDFVSSCPKDFAGVRFESMEYFIKGLYYIFIDDCNSLSEAHRLFKTMLADYQLDFYSSRRYTCTSPSSSKITRSTRYFRDDFDFDSV